MIKLFCDRCNKEILPEEYSLHLEMQEEVYKGKKDFFIDTQCLSGAKILCDKCNEQLKLFFSLF